MRPQTPFEPINLPAHLMADLDDFAETVDFIRLYMTYAWQSDTWPLGFQWMFQLERSMSQTAQCNYVTKEQIRRVNHWGRKPNPDGFYAPTGVHMPLYGESGPDPSLKDDPYRPIERLDTATTHLGPTYLSKVVMFALPWQFGAIDSRQVRVFGRGDPSSQRHAWLDLRAQESVGGGWRIPRTKTLWPEAWRRWINILRYFAHRLNEERIDCPHPRRFVENGLRWTGRWCCVDVQTALFSYASVVTDSAPWPAPTPPDDRADT